jgi:hypothetical protein
MPGHGGRRAGSGRKPAHPHEKQWEVAAACEREAQLWSTGIAYELHRQKRGRRQHRKERTYRIRIKRPKNYRSLTIRKLAKEFKMTERQVDRYWVEWRPFIQKNAEKFKASQKS